MVSNITSTFQFPSSQTEGKTSPKAGLRKHRNSRCTRKLLLTSAGTGEVTCRVCTAQNDQCIFLLLHFIHKCNSRSYHMTSFVTIQCSAARQEADCLLSQGGTGVGSHNSQEHGGLAWGHCPGAMGYGLAPFPLIIYRCLPSPAKSHLEEVAEPNKM